ncbi:MAG TPA: O-antigen ligase family protein [Patescibacteria group bacterium]|uniref:O-antigen ligase-related domain-containing protein n=1 Tax=Candidatus Woesebacteria bacterium RBG_13_46_13 TaxID=1802479 RepID=A0A1F7X752_9BACT|nr:MAG: hypothetical protein A2Y68_01935 [Candidatus Woesebacteria bacterium RBG_13_46_13]HJX59344.1 O-antigen ligase family protein [Patescibacteria group bacterium]
MTSAFKLNPKTLFQLFIFLLPTQLGYHFWPQWAYVFGIRVDYLSPTIFLTDIIFGIFLLLFIKNATKEIRAGLLKVALVVALLAIVNIVFSSSPPTAIFKWLKVAELSLLVFVVARQKGLNFSSWLVKPLVTSAAVFSAIGIAQVLKGGTIGGLLYYLGERSFNTSTPGIALWSFWGEKTLRAYSTFSHPNSFSGYLAVVLILTTHLLLKGKLSKKYLPALFLVLSAFLLTVSLAAIVSLAAVSFGYVLVRQGGNWTKKLSAMVLVGLVVLSMAMPTFAKSFYKDTNTFTESLSKRLSLSISAGQMFSERPLFGIGLNNFIRRLPQDSGIMPAIWWLQPVHNIILLVLTETGIVGALILVGILQIALTKSLSNRRIGVYLAIMFILFTGFLDHYWLTLQQNEMLAAGVLGLSLRKKTG